MALTIVVTDTIVTGNKRHTYGTLAFDSSYPTGGETFTERQLGLGRVDILDVHPKSGYVFQEDLVNKKIQAFWQNMALVVNGPGIEVTDTTSLAALTGVRWEAIGV